MTIYLDYNASTPVHPEVLDEMITVYKESYGNPSSRTHVYGNNAKKIVENARKIIADALGIQSHEIIFTSGATESNNLAIQGLAKWGKENGKRHIISTAIEHNAVLEPLAYLETQGFEVEYVSPDSTGRIDAQDLLSRVRPETFMVSVMHANNETGVIQPVKEIGGALMETDTYFHVDAAQTFGKLVSELKELKYDLLSVTSHKIYGPQGIGALVMRRRGRRHCKVQPLTYGGGQEKGLRPGTVPVALVAGFGKATQLAIDNHKDWYYNASQAKKSILDQLAYVNHSVNGIQSYCLTNCLNVSFPGVDSEALMVAIKQDIAISNGSACSSAAYEPSHVLTAMGADAETAVRLSWGPNVDEIDLSSLIEVVKNFQE